MRLPTVSVDVVVVGANLLAALLVAVVVLGQATNGPEAPAQAAAGPASTQPAKEPDGRTAAASRPRTFPGGSVPILFVATAEAGADAEVGTPAADVLGGPLLTIGKAGLSPELRSELSRLRPARIVILGGSAAVSDDIAAELDTYTTGTVTRLAGSNRYATAARVATTVFTAPVPRVVVSTGEGLVAARADGAIGARTNSPVLLVLKESLPAETVAALRQLQPRNITVLGGTDLVSDAVLRELDAYTPGRVSRESGDPQAAATG